MPGTFLVGSETIGVAFINWFDLPVLISTWVPKHDSSVVIKGI